MRLLLTWGSVALMACTPGVAADWMVETVVPVPNPCWKLRIREVYRRQAEVLIVSDLEPPVAGTFCAQVIAEASDAVRIPGPPGALRSLVLGRAWRADLGGHEASPGGEIVWIADEATLARELRGAELVAMERMFP